MSETENKHTPTPGPWTADRGFRDAGGPGNHYTISDDFITVFCGEEAADAFDPDKHAWIEVHGANQEANAAFLEQTPDLKSQRDELLAAAEECVAAWDNDGRSEPSAARYEYAVGLARTAIRKVKGGEDV